MGPEDASVDEDESGVGRWRAYVASYVMVHPTEWMPNGSGYGPGYLKRYVESNLGVGVFAGRRPRDADYRYL